MKFAIRVLDYSEKQTIKLKNLHGGCYWQAAWFIMKPRIFVGIIQAGLVYTNNPTITKITSPSPKAVSPVNCRCGWEGKVRTFRGRPLSSIAKFKSRKEISHLLLPHLLCVRLPEYGNKLSEPHFRLKLFQGGNPVLTPQGVCWQLEAICLSVLRAEVKEWTTYTRHLQAYL